MDSSSQKPASSPPPKPWEQAGTSSSGPTPFKPPSPGSTSDVVEASGTAKLGEIVPATGYNSSLNYNNGNGSGLYGSSYGGIGGYGGGLYGNTYRGYGGMYSGGMYNGGMYNGGFGGPVGGYGMGMGPCGDQDPNNPLGSPPSAPGFWISFLRVLFDRTGLLYGELARFVVRLLGIKVKPPRVQGPRHDGRAAPHNPKGNQSFIEGPKADRSGAWDNVWGDGTSS